MYRWYVFLITVPIDMYLWYEICVFFFRHKIDEYNNNKYTYGFISVGFFFVCFLGTSDTLKLTVCVWHRILQYVKSVIVQRTDCYG